MSDQRVGLIGHYAACEAEAAMFLLQLACKELARQGCTLAVGPMDGNTWQRYRLLTERGSEPPFFLEPDNPDEWPGQFTAAGFTPLATYCSALNSDLTAEDPRTADLARRVADLGITVHPLRPAQGGLGLGSLLMARCEQASRAAGFTRAIHALFHEANRSGKISGHTARVIRRYTLFARPLGAAA